MKVPLKLPKQLEIRFSEIQETGIDFKYSVQSKWRHLTRHLHLQSISQDY